MNYFAIALLSLFIAMMVYPFINRICTTIEYCAMSRAIGKQYEKGLQIKKEDMEKMIDGWQCEDKK